MDHKIINEIRRINDIMTGKQVLSEQIVPKVLRKIFSVVDDDVARKIVRSTDDTYDDIIRKLRAGESLSDDAMELLLKVIDYDFLAKSLVDQKLLGDKLNTNIQKVIDILKENPGRYDELTTKMDDVIDTFGMNEEFPEELISAIKKDVKSKIDNGVSSASRAADEVAPEATTAAERYAGSRIADFGAGVFRALPLVSRNLKTVVTILAEQRKGIQVLKKEINSLFDDVITGEESLRSVRRTLEDKLATIERIADGGADKVLNEIEAGYKQLLLNGKISKVEYEQFLKDKKTISSTKFWDEFIAPNYKELDKQVDGLGSFFRNGKKAFSPVKLDWTSRKGKYGWIPKATLNKEGIQRAFNFLAFNSAQTGADVLKRLIKSNPPGKAGAQQWVSQTYLRAIGPQLIIPFANAAFWTVWIPATEWFQEGADKLGLDVDWDMYESTFSELLAELWFDNLLDIWNKDPEASTQIELGDFRPVFKSRLYEIIKSFAANNDYKEPNADGEETTTTPTPQTTTLVLDYDSVKNAAPDKLKQWIWSEGDKVYLMANETTDYEVVVQNNEYVVKVGDEIIKLSEY